MADTAVIPKDFQFGVAAKGVATTATQRLALTQCDIRKIPSRIVPTDEMAGILGERKETVTDGPYSVSGGFSLFPRPDELDVLIPLITGGALSGDVSTPAHIDNGFPFQFDRGTDVYNYAQCKISRATFSSSPGGQLALRCDVEGQSRADGGTFPSLDLSLLQPFTHHQAVVTIDGTTYQMTNIVITIENELILDRFENSQTRTEIPHVGQICTLAGDVEFDSNGKALLDIAAGGVSGTSTVVYTNGAYSLTFHFPSLQAAPEDPAATGKRSEMRQDLVLTSRTIDSSAVTAEAYKITIDADA